MLKFLVRYLHHKCFSLKYRLLFFLIIATVIPICLNGSISYYTNISMINNKVIRGIHSSLSQTMSQVEGTLRSLENAWLQLSYVGSTGKKVNSYLSTNSNYEKNDLRHQINEDMALMGFTNQGIKTICYFSAATEQILFGNCNLPDQYDFSRLPLFYRQEDLSFYGPYKSLYPTHRGNVMSIICKSNIPEEEDIDVYIETDFKLFGDDTNTEQYGMKGFYLLVDDKNRIVYSENPREFPVGSISDHKANGKGYIEYKGYCLFSESSAQGWEVLVGITKDDFYRETNNWITRFVLIVIVSLSISIVLAWIIWRMVYNPIRRMNREIELMGDNRYDSSMEVIGITEFDNLLNRFIHMKNRIKELFSDLERKEKLRSQLEIEKLMSQINPHFLYNTLNTIQWVARINGQKLIDHLVLALIRLLHYNLGKEGSFATVDEEVNILKDYVTLQLARSEYQFSVNYHVDQSLKDALIPRFILQPLVENSIYYGIKNEEGIIDISILPEGSNRIIMKVADNGSGMAQETIGRILDEKSYRGQNVGMGIGLGFVIKTIKMHYKEAGKLMIDSKKDAGTAITIIIPVNMDTDVRTL